MEEEVAAQEGRPFGRGQAGRALRLGRSVLAALCSRYAAIPALGMLRRLCLGVRFCVEWSRYRERDSEHGMQLDAVLGKPGLPMREIEEADAGDLHLNVALDNLGTGP